MTITIREAFENDIPAIFDVRTSVLENHLSIEQLADMGITDETIREALRQEPCIWVAEINGKVVGFSMASKADACVFAAFVQPQYEGRGIGRQLMEQAETFLFEHHSVIWLETSGASRAADFYKKIGWKLTQDLENGDVRFEKHQPT